MLTTIKTKGRNADLTTVSQMYLLFVYRLSKMENPNRNILAMMRDNAEAGKPLMFSPLDIEEAKRLFPNPPAFGLLALATK